MNASLKIVFQILPILLWLVGPLRAADDVITVTYPGSLQTGELTCEANYYLWVPPGVKTVRAILVHQHGCGDGAERGCLTAAEDLHWRALAEKWDSALLSTSYRAGDANCGAWADPRRGSQARFHQALRDLGQKSGHPEIETAPWCLWGHSGGGWWCSRMLALEPERVLAAWLRSGSAYGGASKTNRDTSPEVVPAALQVPVMANAGTKEQEDPRFKEAYASALGVFRNWRAKGALIGFAAEPDCNHECGASRYLAIRFFDACLAARLPDQPGGPLKNMPTEPAWLGRLDNGQARPAREFSESANEAVWLPNATVAKAWMEYVKTAKITDATPPPAPYDVTLHGHILTWKAQADLESGLRGFVILRNGQPVATLPGQQKERTVFQGLSFHDTPDQPVPALSLQVVETSGVYRVVSVNTVGLSSTPSAEGTVAERQ